MVRKSTKTKVTALEIEHAIRMVYVRFLSATRGIYMGREDYSAMRYRQLITAATGTKFEEVDALQFAAHEWVKRHFDRDENTAKRDAVQRVLDEQCEIVRTAMWSARNKDKAREARTALVRMPSVGHSPAVLSPHLAYVPRHVLAEWEARGK